MKLGILFIAMVVLVSCSPKKSSEYGVKSVMADYISAVKQNKPKKAWNLLDEDVKKRAPLTWFLARWKKNRKELLAQVKKMENSVPSIKATIMSGDGHRVVMVTEKGKWKVDEAPGLIPTPSSPTQLLSLLIMAIEKMDFPLYISLLSPAYRSSVVATLQHKIKELEKAQKHLSKQTNSSIETLTVPLDRYGKIHIVLKKHGDVWKVDSWQLNRPRKYR
jgi:hypothetical protein